jgi:hypothetical protein
MKTPKAQAKRPQPKQSKAQRKAVPPRSQHVPPQIRDTVEQLRHRFRQKFGRDPGPNDPVFVDPDSDSPVPLRPEALNRLWEGLADSLLNSGEIASETAYAMKKTGLLVTEQTILLMTSEQWSEWNAAVDEYRRINRQKV